MLQMIFLPIGFSLFTLIQVLFISIITLFKKSRFSIFILLLNITIIGLYIGLANRWGYDSIHYYIPFYEGDNSRQFEPGFTLFVYVMKMLGIPSTMFPILAMVISIWIAFYAIYKIVRDPVDTALIAFCLTSMISFMYLYMGGMRQAISFSFVLLSMSYVEKKSPVKSYISIVVAISLHFSALIFLALFFWQKISIQKKYLIVLLSLAFALLSEYIVSSILKILPPGSVFVDKIIRAFEYSDRNDEHAIYIYKFLCTSIFVLLPQLLGVSQNKISENAKLVLEYALLTYVISALLFFSKESSIRYLFIVNIFLVLFYIIHTKNIIVSSQRKIVLFFIFIFFFAYGFISHNWLSELTTRFI